MKSFDVIFHRVPARRRGLSRHFTPAAYRWRAIIIDNVAAWPHRLRSIVKIAIDESAAASQCAESLRLLFIIAYIYHR